MSSMVNDDCEERQDSDEEDDDCKGRRLHVKDELGGGHAECTEDRYNEKRF